MLILNELQRNFSTILLGYEYLNYFYFFLDGLGFGCYFDLVMDFRILDSPIYQAAYKFGYKGIHSSSMPIRNAETPKNAVAFPDKGDNWVIWERGYADGETDARFDDYAMILECMEEAW
jgi:hypothetical protein